MRTPLALAAVVLTAVGVIAVAAGCSSLQPDAAEATQVVQQFGTALRDGDGEEICELLAPETVEEVEQETQSDCADAITEQGLPHLDPETVSEVRAYGRAAQARMDIDTIFLTRSGSSWKITAAGCAPRSDAPYDCLVEGN